MSDQERIDALGATGSLFRAQQRPLGAPAGADAAAQPPGFEMSAAAGGPDAARELHAATPDAPAEASGGPAEGALNAGGQTGPADVVQQLRRVEAVLVGIRGMLEAQQREAGYREYSVPRIIGAVAQALAIVLAASAAADWLFGYATPTILVKLGFVTALQLGALTGFVVARRRE